MKRAKLKRDYHGLIASIPNDGNDLVDKHFSYFHYIKSIYFNDEELISIKMKIIARLLKNSIAQKIQ